MTQAWIVFKIKDQQVYQIKYNGCTGQDLIDTYKTMIAGEYKVQEVDILVSFTDDLRKEDQASLQTKVISSELVKQVQELVSQKVNQN